MALDDEGLRQLRKRVLAGGAERYHAANAAKGKLFARERVALLVDEGSFVEDGLLANALVDGLPADGVVTGLATIDGRPVCLMANDSTVKAGSWGARTVEKIIRVIERAYADGVPMVYLVDSAGARITDQVDLFPGRRGAGNIFYNQVRASGSIPQVCALFGPSAAGGAYIPAFCDVVAMVDGNASMYLGSDRMVEMVTGEKTTLEAMGGARVHCAESGVGHFLCKTETEALDVVRRYLSYLPSNWQGAPPAVAPARHRPRWTWPRWCRPASGRRSTCAGFVRGLLDEGSYFEIQALWAREVTVGFGRLDGEVGRRGRQQLAAQGRRAVRRLGRQGDPVRPALRRVQRAAAVPVRRARIHGGHGGGEAGHHPARREDDHGDRGGDRAEDLRRGTQGVRRGPLRDGRPRVRAGRHHRAADREDRRDGCRGRRQRRLRQQDRGHCGRRGAGGLRRGQAGRVRAATSTSCTWPANSWWTPIVEPSALREELVRRFARASGKDRHFSRRRHGVTPV